MNKILLYDIETFFEAFIVVVLIPGEHVRKWEVSKWKNELDSFIKFTEDYSDYFWTGYNNLRFDSQVIEWILHNYEKWYDTSSLEICKLISQKATDVIDDANYDVFPEYREEQLSLKQIDLFRIWHFDNKNRRVSLKRLEFEMDFENIEELPFDHLKQDLTRKEVIQVIEYCVNDVKATYEFYKITIGETEHSLYKENDQIQLRENIQEEFNIPCLNYSDSKIGDEIIKKYYCQERGITYNSLPKKGTFRKEIKVRDCIARYIEFQTKELTQFLRRIKSLSFRMKDEFKESLKFYSNTYSFMKGGLHTENSPKIFEATEDILLIDWDVSSYYPAIIINNNKYPAHLGTPFLRGYKQMFEKRLKLKSLAKEVKRIAGIVGALKLSVNSVFGKSSDIQNWIYDRQLTLFTCITGELSLMMLIEAYELSEIHVISANTDGVTIMVHKGKLEKMDEINSWWQTLTNYFLERTDYKKIIFSTVNDYIAIKTNGELKKKGDFLTDFELYQNKSARIVPLALEQYYVNNIPIEQTINSHKNIYDFAIRQKSSKDFHYEGINKKTGEKTIYNKLIRYYVSNTGEKILKIKNPECTTNAAPIIQVEAGDWLMRVCNYLPKSTKVEHCNIDYSYYIERANKIVDKIKYRGRKVPKIDKQQLTLW